MVEDSFESGSTPSEVTPLLLSILDVLSSPNRVDPWLAEESVRLKTVASNCSHIGQGSCLLSGSLWKFG